MVKETRVSLIGDLVVVVDGCVSGGGGGGGGGRRALPLPTQDMCQYPNP